MDAPRIHSTSDKVLYVQIDELGGRSFSQFESECADSDGQIEAARTTRAGVEIKHAFFLLDVWPMRVAIENGGKLCRGRIEPQHADVVEQIDVMAFEEKHVGLRQFAAWAIVIDVAANGVNRSDLFEGCENRLVADI